MFEHSVHSLLAYFLATHRLLTVDVSSKDADAAASRTCHVLRFENKYSLFHEYGLDTYLVPYLKKIEYGQRLK